MNMGSVGDQIKISVNINQDFFFVYLLLQFYVLSKNLSHSLKHHPLRMKCHKFKPLSIALKAVPAMIKDRLALVHQRDTGPQFSKSCSKKLYLSFIGQCKKKFIIYSKF